MVMLFAGERRLSAAIGCYWTNYATVGDPNGNGDTDGCVRTATDDIIFGPLLIFLTPREPALQLATGYPTQAPCAIPVYPCVFGCRLLDWFLQFRCCDQAQKLNLRTAYCVLEISSFVGAV